jgi:hypothetical protein
VIARHLTSPVSQLGGSHGPFESTTDLPADVRGYLITFTKADPWPTKGDIVRVVVEFSPNGGADWFFDASITLAAGEWRDPQGNPSNQAVWHVSLPGGCTKHRRARISYEALQPCALGLALESV